MSKVSRWVPCSFFVCGELFSYVTIFVSYYYATMLLCNKIPRRQL